MKVWNIMLSFLVVTGMTGCFSADPDPEQGEGFAHEILKISYGTSFGFCIGYCIHTVDISPGKLLYTRDGWNDSVQEITCDDPYNPEDYLDIAMLIESDKFFQLPETIGCPDCADGGAEWLEIQTAEKIHRVTFEYRNEPEILGDVINVLREITEEYENCEP